MCGISGICGPGTDPLQLRAMLDRQRHRGPDDEGVFLDAAAGVALGHNRLAILDLSAAGRQPMASADGRYRLVFNGEIYNYVELRRELCGHCFRTGTDTEVLLAAFERWGAGCLDRLVGMFAFAVWDGHERELFAARDRFGIKPFHYRSSPDTFRFSSEIKALDPSSPDEAVWAGYLAHGVQDRGGRTFWKSIRSLPAGHTLTWRDGRARLRRWYDLAERAGTELDERPDAVVEEEYLALLEESVRLRFRADVPVGINLSGGIDSSTLLALVGRVQGPECDVKAFTFATGDAAYDELPWVERMLERTRHPSVVCRLDAGDVPDLARSVQEHQDEPFGGLPTLAYARLFERAAAEGVTVLLDGQGMDEQWAGYDYYRSARAGVVQGSRESPVRPDCLVPEFCEAAAPFRPARPFADDLRNLQHRDATETKIPRALRFNDRVSMRASRELREPFLDHRLFELAMRQPPRRKIAPETGKVFLRSLARRLCPRGVVEAPKRPLQTPQREWLRGPLQAWATEMIRAGLDCGWLEQARVEAEWRRYRDGRGDNSFFVWQWITLGLMCGSLRRPTAHV